MPLLSLRLFSQPKKTGGDLFLPSDEEESGAGVGGLDDDSDADEVSCIQFTPLLRSNNAHARNPWASPRSIMSLHDSTVCWRRSMALTTTAHTLTSTLLLQLQSH